MRADAAVFTEEQRFLSGRLVVALLAAVVVAAGFLIAYGQPRELIPAAIGLAVFAILGATRLQVQVSPEDVTVDFRPLAHRRIPMADISSCDARVYRPIREYGGWGLRWGWKGGRAYNVRGNRGVQLTLRNGDSILLGSQRADELAAAIRQGMAT